MKGKLYIVATPIGNLKDITLRALDILESVSWIACEDTRHTKKLLHHFGFNKQLISLHDHNEHERKSELLERLCAGETGALVSDAGTPLINDPGYHLVSYLKHSNIDIVPIPGPSALITALSACGMPTDRFTFEGFLPAKSTKRQALLSTLLTESRTMVFYESTHRLMSSLNDIEKVFGKHRQLCVAKELTKQHERFVCNSVSLVIQTFNEYQDWQKGEFVFVLSGVEEINREITDGDELIQLLVSKNLPIRQISEIVSEYKGLKKKEVYQRALELKK